MEPTAVLASDSGDQFGALQMAAILIGVLVIAYPPWCLARERNVKWSRVAGGVGLIAILLLGPIHAAASAIHWVRTEGLSAITSTGGSIRSEMGPTTSTTSPDPDEPGPIVIGEPRSPTDP